MHESVYIILEQIFCTRNDGARCVISTHLYLCHVIRLVILYIRSLGSGRARTGGRRTGEKGKEKDGTREREKKGLWIRGNLKREKGTDLVQRARCNDCFSPPGEADAIR